MKRLDAREVGARIRAARQAAELTQSRLAESAGMEVQSLSRLERGEYEPSLSSAVAIAGALGLSLDELVLGTQASEAPGRPSQLRLWTAVSGAREELLRSLMNLQAAEDAYRHSPDREGASQVEAGVFHRTPRRRKATRKAPVRSGNRSPSQR